MKAARLCRSLSSDRLFATAISAEVFCFCHWLFRDRDRYVDGDSRFKSGYSKHNPRKMVKMWAEKEMRNLLRSATVIRSILLFFKYSSKSTQVNPMWRSLQRLSAAGIRCPAPVILRLHVLVMSFIGKLGGVVGRRSGDWPLFHCRSRYPACYHCFC